MELIETKNGIEITDSGKLYTAKELSEEFGLPLRTIQDWLLKSGSVPVVESSISKDGQLPSKYGETSRAHIQVRLRSANLAANERIEKHVSALTPAEKALAVRKNLEQLIENDDLETMLGVAGMMVQGLALAATKAHDQKQERIEYYEKELQRKDRIIEDLEVQLDRSTTQMTVETYAIRVLGTPVERKVAAKVTRLLHRSGRDDLGKVPSKYDPNMLSTVWLIGDLDFAHTEGWLEWN
jgi:hypothetical protein